MDNAGIFLRSVIWGVLVYLVASWVVRRFQLQHLIVGSEEGTESVLATGVVYVDDRLGAGTGAPYMGDGATPSAERATTEGCPCRQC